MTAKSTNPPIFACLLCPAGSGIHWFMDDILEHAIYIHGIPSNHFLTTIISAPNSPLEDHLVYLLPDGRKLAESWRPPVRRKEVTHDSV